MKIKYLGNNKGVTLVLVMIVMMIMTVLGTVIINISVTEANHAARDNKSKQAYYLARSGVEATVSWMLDHSNNGAALIGQTSDETKLRNDIKGTFTVEVIGDVNTPELLIKGIGTVDGVSANAGLVLKKIVAATTPVFKYNLYADNIVLLSGDTTINGDIGAGTSINSKGNVTVIGDKDSPVQMDLPSPILPADPSTADNVSYSNETVLDITAEPNQILVHKKLTLQGGSSSVLTFYTGDADNVVTLVVEELDLKIGVVKITGNGRLDLFIKSKGTFNSDTNYNDPLASDPKQLMVYLDEGASATVNGNRKFFGFIYGPEATVTIGGNGGFTGAIIANNITASGTPFADDYVLDPNDITFDDLPVFNYSRGSWVRP